LLAKSLTQDAGFSKKRTLRGFRIVAYGLKAVATALQQDLHFALT
jgi:hypothetical protein